MEGESIAKAEMNVGEESYGEFPMRKVEIGPLNFNPFVSIVATVGLWGIAGYCMAQPEAAKATLAELMQWTSYNFTWFFMVVPAVFIILLAYIYIYYGDQRLGPPNSKPEFDDPTYFAMIFSAGVAVGLFFFGIDEPLYHQVDNRFATKGYLTEDELDTWAMTLTIFHWGLCAWAVYAVVALSLGIASYRNGLPMTLRSGFYPMLGEWTWGWIGDLIDTITIITVVAGVCTSLGLGAFQITNGLVFTGTVPDSLSEEESSLVNICVIWVVTGVATVSVVSGLDVGIRWLSRIAFVLGCILWFLVFFLDKPMYLANLIVQTTGHYFNYGVIEMVYQTDAFGQLAVGEGRAINGGAAESYWMNAWTVFYWAWWTSWSGFVGLFLARISKGRTVRQVILYSTILPILYTLLWFGVFGGAGLRYARKAKELAKLGLDVYDDADYFLVNGSSTCYAAPTPEDAIYENVSLATGYENTEVGIGPYCLFYTLTPGTVDWDGGYTGSLWYQVLDSYYIYGVFLCWLSIVCVAIYFVTSSDSGSFVVDHLASNGSLKHHWSQKVYWAVTEGALASALLYAGGNDALRALQAASIFVGLPFDALLCMLAVCLVRNLSQHAELEKAKKEGWSENIVERKGFKMPVFGGIFDIFEVALSLGRIPEERNSYRMPTVKTLINFAVSLGIPSIPLLLATNDIYGKPNMVLVVAHSGFLYTTVILLFVSIGVPAIEVFALLSYILSASSLAVIRASARQTYGLYGNLAEDFCACFFVMPQVVAQLALQVGGDKEVEDEQPQMNAAKDSEMSDEEASKLA